MPGVVRALRVIAGLAVLAGLGLVETDSVNLYFFVFGIISAAVFIALAEIVESLTRIRNVLDAMFRISIKRPTPPDDHED